MVNYDEYYEYYFENLPLGSVITVDKDGGPYTGTLIFKSRHYITLQLPYYREGFSLADFFIGHSFFKIEGVDLPPLPGQPMPIRRPVTELELEEEVDFPG